MVDSIAADADAGPPFVLTLREAVERMDGIEALSAGGVDGVIAWPASAAAKPELRYPLVVLVGAGEILGSAIEMSRLMATTSEIRESILVAIPAPGEGGSAALERTIRDEVVPAVRARGRLEDGPTLVFAPGLELAGSDALVAMPAETAPERLVPTLVDGLRARLSTGKRYADEIVPLRRRPIMAALNLLRPVFAWRRRRSAPALGDPTRFLVRSDALDREFEVFAILPSSAESEPRQRYPALLVMDALIELSVVAETAALLEAAGRIPPLVVIGIGDPRREGMQTAALRRFEEFAPPTDGYAFDDELGRIFRSLGSAFGRDARTTINLAPGMRAFVVDELLPRLVDELPIDPADLGIVGHSAGGTFVLYALHTGAPFRRYLALSPGIGMSGSWLVRTVDDRDILAAPRRSVFLSLGTEERVNAFNRIAGIPETEGYGDLLRARGDVDVTTTVLEGQTHSSVFPGAVAAGLLAVYGSR